MRLRTSIITLALLAPSLWAAPRDVQIRSIDFITNTIEIHNYGSQRENLGSWRLWSDSVATEGWDWLRGISLGPGESAKIGPIRSSDGIALPRVENYQLVLLYPLAQFHPAQFADVLGWSGNGMRIPAPHQNYLEAGESVGLWVDGEHWIKTHDPKTNQDAVRIELKEDVGALSEPADYFVRFPSWFRAVQIRSVDFDAGVVELHNFGADPMPLDGWQLVTQDHDESRPVSDPDALNGITLASEESLFIHLRGDAPPDPLHVNFAGELASPFGRVPYGLVLYWHPGGFNNNYHTPQTMADYVLWTPGVPGGRTRANGRSEWAAAAGLWSGKDHWVRVQPSTARLLLTGDPSQPLHGPNDYLALESYQSWIATQGLPLEDQDPLEDPDRDSLTNLEEYAHDLVASASSPLDENAISYGSEEEEGVMYFTFDYIKNRGKSDLTMQAEASVDLVTFGREGVEERVLEIDGNFEHRRARIVAQGNFAAFRLVYELSE